MISVKIIWSRTDTRPLKEAIKRPGESDGSCHTGDPAAGQWFNSYALRLVARRLK
jgi:hypothetical protein